MVRTKYFAAAVAAILTVLATGCIVSFEPETAVNPVGTEHTVTVTLRDNDEITEEVLCEILTDVFEDLEEILEEEDIVILNPCLLDASVDTAQEANVFFQVISGPNTGTNSEDDGECEPSCSETDADNQISWTYRSNGVAGTDVIRVCSDFFLMPPILENEVSASQLTEEEFFELISDALLNAINEEFNSDYESLEEIECQTVRKTWVEQRPPNIGAGLSGLFQGQPTALPTAPAPAAVAPAQTTIRPPSTGDAGLQ